jgi:hypothetical protein
MTSKFSDFMNTIQLYSGRWKFQLMAFSVPQFSRVIWVMRGN